MNPFMNQYPNMNQYAGNFQPNMYQQFQNMYNNMSPNDQNGMCLNPFMYQQFMNQQNMNMNQQNMNYNNMNMNQLFAQFMQWLNMNNCNNLNMNVCNNPNMNVCNNPNMNVCNNPNMKCCNNPNMNNNNMNGFNNINVNNNNANLNGGNNNIINSGDGKNVKETLPRGDKLVEFKNEYPDEEMENMKNIIFLATSGYRVAIIAPFYETISNILKLYTKKIGIGENTIENEIFFIFDATYLHKDDQRAINELCQGQNVTITVIDSGNLLGAK
jgi:hypothetical protein